MELELCRGLYLHGAGTTGPKTGYTRIVALEGRNTLRASVLVYAQTGDGIIVQTQQALDPHAENWTDQGDAELVQGIGHQVLEPVTVTGAYARLKITESNGRAVVDSFARISHQ